MSITERTLNVDDHELASMRLPLDDMVLEEPIGPDVWRCAEGPFDRYERRLRVEPDGDGRHRVTETVEWELAIPVWGAMFRPLVRRYITNRDHRIDEAGQPVGGSPPWWSPPDRLDARATAMVARLCTLSMVVGYLGTLLTQTITFASDQFHASTSSQGLTLASARAGVLLSLVIMTIADRRGRQRLLVVCTISGILAASLGALAPNLTTLGATQFLTRSFSTALALLIAVVAAEEMPAGGRAYAASVVAMTTALGAGGAVLLLPLADLHPGAWRILYVAPLLALPTFARLAGRVPESRRFMRPHARVTMKGHRGRLTLLGASTFFGVMFLAPVTQFQNEFLREERGFSALAITIFTICTNTPAGIGVVVGGRLADQRGRKVVGAVGTLGGAVLLAAAFHASGIWLWLAWVVGGVIGAMTVPALAVYGPELFPTALRGRANGIISLTGVIGAAIGLFAAGWMSDRYGSIAPGLTVLAAGPLVVTVLVLTLYPETAHLELEELNPEDAAFLRPSG
ncbi:MAG: MFS transporter [Acidimicrobiales bacterium]|jgi:MFS family permease